MTQAAVPALPRRCQTFDELRRRQCLRRAVYRLMRPGGGLVFVCPEHARALLVTQTALIA